MARRKTEERHPLSCWIRLITQHDAELTQLELLWRRGGQDYRPMIPSEGLPPEQLEGVAWEDDQIPDTRIDWNPSTGESLDDYRKRITELVDNLWAIAQKWTHSQGVWCDYKLVGLNNLEIVFEKGKRCQGPQEGSDSNSNSPDGTKRDETSSNQLHDFLGQRELERRVNRRVEDFLDRMTEERNLAYATARESLETAQRAFASTQESMDAAPQMLTKASEVLKDSIDYQREQVRQLKEHAYGIAKLQAHAVTEQERSRRFGAAVDLGKHMWDTGLTTILPAANRVFEVLGNRNMTVFPEFKAAQQAMVYLAVTLTPHQLGLLFPGRKLAGSAMVGLLDEAAKFDNEREALLYVADVIRVLRSEQFRDVATAEQQMAARFVLGRLAMYRMSEQ